jgi:outer membrane cobalamin receptor
MSLTVIATVTALADEDEEDLDNIVVTGARTTNTIEEIPNTTTVIRLDEIQARNNTSVAELLRSIPGIHVTQPSGQGGVARVYVRGGDLEMTMILFDGVRVNDPNDARGSAFDFSTVNMYDVERVEIVRGPQSAVYGSDALAGVINIISKGTDDYYRGAFDVSGPVGEGGGFSLRVATKDDGEPVSQTTFEGNSVTGKLSVGSGQKWDMRLFGNYSDSQGTAFPEDSGGLELAVLRTVDTRSSEDLRLGVDASVGLARIDVAVNAIVELGDKVTITFGADYYDEDGRSNGFVEFAPGFIVPSGFEFDRSVVGGFAEIHYNPDSGPTLLASVRRDDPNEESGETTAKFGILQDFNQGQTSLRANWGQGFSLPRFFALASPLVGNPSLRSETSKSLDLGVTHWFDDRRVAATVMLFRNEFTDLIDFDSTIFMMVNRDRVEIDGVELQLDYSITDEVSLRAQATYLDIEVVNSSTPLRQRPDWRGSLAVDWSPSDKLSLHASWLNVGETFDSSIPTGDMFLDGYSRVDAAVTFRQSNSLDLVLSVDNLFDEDYQEAIGFPSPGTRARLGIRYQF